MTNISLPELPLPVLANNQTHQCWFTAEQMMDFAKDAVRIYRLTSTNNTSKQAAGEAVGEGCGLCGGFCNHPEEHTPPRHPADEGVAMQWPRGVLNRDKTLELLISHNEWRRGKEGPQTDPRLLGLALEATIAAIQAGSP